MSKRKPKHTQPPGKPVKPEGKPAAWKYRFPLTRRAVLSLSAGIVLLVIGSLVFADWWICLPDEVQATYVGGHRCIECHQDYYEQWQGSHHDLAMDRATDETVLADFNDAEFEAYGVRSRMYRQDGRFMVNTEGPDGKLADFEVKYVFGYTPLQQFMVEFDRPAEMPDNEVARLQVLRLTWDTERGRWFHLDPPDVREKLEPDDELHWTGVAQRWNNMCADCHSTNLQKNYDVKTQTYHTTYSEINVSCEACHGPGSVHVDLANRRSLFWDRKRGFGLPKLKDDQQTLIESCAPCHSRRRVLAPGFCAGDAYYDYYGNELLERATYHADGQILDEVYVYASFIQSKMYHKDIKCTDCHDPHTARLKYNGNNVCTSCHQHPAGKYDGPSHHFHQPGSPGSLCVECHMPQNTYMAVDPRRDHSLRIPSPQLSIDLGMPNACSRCHVNKAKAGFADRDDLTQYQDWILAARNGDEAVRDELQRVNQEMAAAVVEWYGDKSEQQRQQKKHFAYVLDAARRAEPGIEPDLRDLAQDGRLPAIVRATALFELGRYGNPASTQACLELLDDPDPQIRSTAVISLQSFAEQETVSKRLVPLLNDRVRVVRIEAARALARVNRRELRGDDRRVLESALAELETAILMSNDRSAAHMTMGLLYEDLQETNLAIDAYETAIRIEPNLSGPRSNLAAMYDRLAEREDQQAIESQRMGQMSSAERAVNRAEDYRQQATELRARELENLARDARLVPDNAAVQYRYGMSLYLHRRFDEAEQALKKAAELEPNTPDFLLGIALYYKEVRRRDDAIPWAERLVALRPENPMYGQVLNEIRQMPP